jgi:hypothetical protein
MVLNAEMTSLRHETTDSLFRALVKPDFVLLIRSQNPSGDWDGGVRTDKISLGS